MYLTKESSKKFDSIYSVFCVIVIQVDGFGKEGYVMKLDIRSAAFEEGESIPKNIHVMALMFHRNCLGRNHLKEQKAWH